MNCYIHPSFETVLQFEVFILQNGNRGTAWLILTLSLGSAECTRVGTKQLQQRLNVELCLKIKHYAKQKYLMFLFQKSLAF